MPDSEGKIYAVILAGGRGSRLNCPATGREKALLPLTGKPLIQHVISTIAPQVDGIIVSANQAFEQYSAFGYPVIEDADPARLGPLAGIAAAMRFCRDHDDKISHLLTVPCDTPFLPPNLVDTMRRRLAASSDNKICLAHDGERTQQLIALLSLALLPQLEQSLTRGELKVGRWMREQPHCQAHFDSSAAFFNINTPADLEQARRR